VPKEWRSRAAGLEMRLSLQFVRVVALGGWIGAITYFAAGVTEGAFAVLPSPDDAGLLVGFTLGRLHLMGLVSAAIFIAASLALAKSLTAVFKPAVAGVIVMGLLTIASQYHVLPRMARLRSQMGSVHQTPPSDPRRGEFDRLHKTSVDVEGAVLLVGLIALFLALREDRSPAEG